MNRIKELREKAGLSQRELAEKLGVSKQAVSDYENGKTAPSVKTIELIANIFHVKPDYIAEWFDDSNSNDGITITLTNGTVITDDKDYDNIDFMWDDDDFVDFNNVTIRRSEILMVQRGKHHDEVGTLYTK